MIQIEEGATLKINNDLTLYNNWGNSYHRIESRYSKSTDLWVGGNIVLNSSPLHIGGEWDAGTSSNYAALRYVTVGGNISVKSTSSTTSALFMNVGYDGDTGSITNPQVKIGGKVILTSSDAKTADWHLLNRASTATTLTKTFIELNGLEGNGKVTSSAKNTLANEATLIFKNTTESAYSGTILQGSAATFHLIMNGSSKQTLRGSNTFGGGITVESGTLLVNGSTSSLGAFVLNGGKLGAIGADTNVGTLMGASLTATGGQIYTAFDGDTCSLVSLSGDLTADALAFYFEGSYKAGKEYRIFEMANSASFVAENFSSNISGADFDVRDGGVYVTFAVPEPSSIAAVLGVFTLAIAAYRRKTK